MNENANVATSDSGFDLKLRPQELTDFVGNEAIIVRLKMMIQAAKERNESLGHVLFHGPPGLGKTTLAAIVAREMGANFVTSSGPAIEKAGDLAGILTNLQENDVLFIDEIHRLQKNIEEYLYSAMEDFCLDLMIDSGPSARSISVSLNKFTLIGATTRMGNLSAPLRSRFPIGLRLEYYDLIALSKIITRSAKLLGVAINTKSATEIAKRSRGTPRVANNILRWVRDFAQIHNKNVIDEKTVNLACSMIAVDELGLDEMDKKILRVIIDHHEGGPVGIKSIAASIGEEETTLIEVYEPYLIMNGFLKRTPRGREVTKHAYDHLGER
jgi:Holliday junction DNA helicase RuvB